MVDCVGLSPSCISCLTIQLSYQSQQRAPRHCPVECRLVPLGAPATLISLLVTHCQQSFFCTRVMILGPFFRYFKSRFAIKSSVNAQKPNFPSNSTFLSSEKRDRATAAINITFVIYRIFLVVRFGISVSGVTIAVNFPSFM